MAEYAIITFGVGIGGGESKSFFPSKVSVHGGVRVPVCRKSHSQDPAIVCIRWWATFWGLMMANREELSAAFIAALSEDYAQSGNQALERVRNEAPERYLALVAALVPRAVPEAPQEDKYSAMSLQELREHVAGLSSDDEVCIKALAYDLPRYEALIRKARKYAKEEGLSWPPLTPKQKWMKQHRGQYVSDDH
jgi:hypothetical protein